MHDLETCRLVAPNSRCVPLVPRLSLPACVLEYDIRGLKDFDGQSMSLVLSDRLQETGNQRRPNDLEFEGLGVGNLDASITIVFVVQPFEVLLM